MKYYIYILILLISCSTEEEQLINYALKTANKNKSEIQEALVHFQNEPTKEKAIKFIIKNMPNKYYIAGNDVINYHLFIDSIYKIEQQEYNEAEIYRSFKTNKKSDRNIILDLQDLNANYLIKHIDEGFEVQQKPWNSHLTAEEFNEWILPYRIGNELPENWRSLYKKQFEHLLTDSILTAKDACTVINNKLIELPIHIAETSIQPSDIRPSSLINIKFGLCEDYAALAVYAMRSVGIPVGIEIIPHWGRSNQNHTFNVVYDNDGNYYDFSGGEQNPGDHLKRFTGIPKVYRKTFAIQKKSLAMIHGKEEIPPFFRTPCLIDVTQNYDFIQAKNISLPLDRNRPDKKYAYLCVFDPNGWTPIDWCKIQKNKAYFSQVGPNIMYQIACYDERQIKTITAPFFVDSCGVITYTHSGKETTLTLERKFRPSTNLTHIPPSMPGSKFQASDYPDFRSAEDLYIFETEPSFKYTTIHVKPKKSYKYYRYLASDNTNGNMAEVEFYQTGTNEKISGKVIGIEGGSIYYPNAIKENLFDGDALSFFHTNENGSWAGLSLDKPVEINKIRYIIRNDDNGIRKDNLYELYYIDREHNWASAGQKVATDDDLITFDCVPKGTLYWLRNLTRGREERIFTYENGQQIWW